MTEKEHNKICQDCLKTVIDRSPPDNLVLQHLQTCAQCRRAANMLELIRLEGSAFADESHPELKLKLIKRLAPLVKNRSTATKSSPLDKFAWLWKLSLAFFIIITAIAAFAPRQIPVGKAPGTNAQIATLPSQDLFYLKLNGGETREVSIDNPVALFANDSGEIILPDKSRLLVTGPARLTIAPRGFHLLQGCVRAEIARGNGEFTATTPHGIITVLGTVFVCESHSRFTTVEVLKGKVRVSSDNATAIILGAGEKSRMGQQTTGAPETGTIPSLDSE